MNVFTPKVKNSTYICVIRFFSQYTANSGTINVHEIEHHSNMKEYWWNKKGPLKSLHSLNPLRVSFLINGLLNTKNINSMNLNTTSRLKNIKILDVGCGGGILTEALSRLDGDVTGIDASNELIEVAKNHSLSIKHKKIRYVNEPIEDHVRNNVGMYDVVVSSEVIEHISNKQSFLTSCVECLKPGGSLFITTPNRTFISWLNIVVLGEQFDIIPKGTHEWEKFICPHELQSILEMNCNCNTVSINGLSYNPLTNFWSWANTTNLTYALHAIKNK